MKAKLNGTEWDAFSRRSRKMLSWKAGTIRKIKRMFWHKMRRRSIQTMVSEAQRLDLP